MIIYKQKSWKISYISYFRTYLIIKYLFYHELINNCLKSLHLGLLFRLTILASRNMEYIVMPFLHRVCQIYFYNNRTLQSEVSNEWIFISIFPNLSLILLLFIESIHTMIFLESWLHHWRLLFVSKVLLEVIILFFRKLFLKSIFIDISQYIYLWVWVYTQWQLLLQCWRTVYLRMVFLLIVHDCLWICLILIHRSDECQLKVFHINIQTIIKKELF